MAKQLSSFPRAATAAELRKAAESADGRRGRTLYLMYAARKDKSGDAYIMYDPNDPKDVEAYKDWDLNEALQTETDWTCSSHSEEAKTGVKVTPPSSTEIPLDSRYSDSLFWSESAVEKFIFPYYARQLSMDQFQDLYNTYMNLEKDGRTPRTGPQVMGLIHLPTSDYEDDGTGFRMSDNVREMAGGLADFALVIKGREKPQRLVTYLLEHGSFTFV